MRQWIPPKARAPFKEEQVPQGAERNALGDLHRRGGFNREVEHSGRQTKRTVAQTRILPQQEESAWERKSKAVSCKMPPAKREKCVSQNPGKKTSVSVSPQLKVPKRLWERHSPLVEVVFVTSMFSGEFETLCCRLLGRNKELMGSRCVEKVPN